MPWSGGSFSRTDGTRTGTTVWAQAKAAAVKIIATDHDTHDQDISDGINACLNKNGQNSPSANISWNSKKITNLASGTASGDALHYGQIGAQIQAYDAELAALAGLTSAADKVPYFTGSGTAALADLPSFGRTLIANTTAALARIDLGVGTIGDALFLDETASDARTTLGLGTAATVNLAVTGISGIELVRKTADESVSSSTTLQNDDELYAALAANEVVVFRLTLAFNASASGDIKMGFTIPSGASMWWNNSNSIYVAASGSIFDNNNLDETGTRSINGEGADRTVTLVGYVANSSTPGNLQLQWAQDSSDPSLTKVLIGSHLLLWRE